ncbi:MULTISPECIES: Xaa-Pro peptidase family protein [unclassified Mycolicibacterium]|uniref:M24 family metallopeptidase n=1 Tax=unclassified Mycolicibacterium TaxID=2636767 RepID=UPI00130A8152|nr:MULTISPECIES: Xaa-Pro peptidase family protein [unclassified Mycolicibacterium]MUL84422.1 aminopeptidase P family protein [Mycolicibacterium sp. CBMA 329]MUL88197.1 aminopeptidase P family protein [Mycolicibacterium sp. CBMA 331]MUL99354.1 aminopeptidase P family protein [Mycolicibacterium sp. CBMA 334]MUM27982.1 aminopeptidase P family protein [Mycolicibacterium sp. CBMA 295]MUM39844.1 aminopeptidase P family protein [Mycolicibacterium sp. CBMA 247]
MTISQRRDRLRCRLADSGLDAMLVTDLVNVHYLSGFTGSNAALLILAEDTTPVLATDGRYRTQAAQQAPDAEVVIERACGAHLAGRAARAGALRLGFESHVVTVDAYTALKKAAGDAVEWVRAAGTVEALREIKDAGEIAMLRLACEAADAALAGLLERGGLRPGRTERQVRNELEALMLNHGADGPSFETIVATGPNSAIPHHRPTDAVLAAGDFVKIDFGALVAGYHSDMTRTFVLGPAAQWQRDIYDLVATAQQAGRDALAPGVSLSAVDAASRQVIADAGYGENFGHGLGHGVGLQIHEAPGINAAAAGTLLAGSAVTVEPGVYLPDRGGVRIEDTLVVGEAAPDLLTRFPKELTIL